MKNVDYIRKYNLGVFGEIGERPIDDQINQRRFLSDFYFDYKSLLEYEILKGEIQFKTYDQIYIQMKQKLDSLGKRTPYDLPQIFYNRLDVFYHSLMPEFCPLLHNQIEKLKRYSSDHLEEVLREGGIRGFHFRKISDNDLAKTSKITQIAYAIYKEKIEQEKIERNRKEEERRRIHKERMENDPEYRKKHEWESYNSFFNFNGFFNDFLNDILKSNVVPNDEFKILGLNSDCTIEEVKKAYRKMALEHHPDKGGSKEKFIEVTEAKDKILNYLERAI